MRPLPQVTKEPLIAIPALAHVYFFGRKLLKAHERFWQLVTT
jgi:hypothetical protein